MKNKTQQQGYIDVFVDKFFMSKKKINSADFAGKIAAIDKVQAVIEFNMDGTIISANDNFLNTLDYSLDEIQNKHHSMFVEPDFKDSAEYQQFWEKLNRGEFESKEYKRLGKRGKEVWIQASYNPIMDLNGKLFKVVKYATDVTEQKLQNADVSGQLDAISKAQALIEFNMDGTIISANDNFLNTLGYSLEEIRGKHHSMFVEPDFKDSAEYQQFWEKLNRGEFESKEYKRLGKRGKEVWIQASYNPIMDLNGKPFKVVKYANDVTEQKLRNADVAGQLEAIGKAQAVIEFNMDGTIINANDNFLNTLGYSLEEIIGKHHSMFVEPTFKNSAEYQQFWEKLNRGEYESKEYKRLGKNGKEVWIQASYNPIMDLNDKPFKVVKYATDVTEQKLQNADVAGQLDAIGKAQAVIEFNMDGTIIKANDNFLNTLGYSLEEIRGKHHSMFVETAFKNSAEYQQFWERLNRGEYEASEYKRVGKGGKEVWIQASYNPIMDLNDKPLKVVKYATDITAQKLEAMENARIKLALGTVSSCVMIADADFNIIYTNDTLQDLMRVAETDIRSQIPGFDASRLVGSNIDMFYRTTVHERGTLENLTSTFNTQIELGRRTFVLAANPVFVDGKRTGTVVEWRDRTGEVAMEKEIDSMVEAAGTGDLTKSISLEGKDGFFRNLGSGLNTLVNSIDVALREIAENATRVAAASSQTSTAIGQISDGAQNQLHALAQVSTAVTQSSAAASDVAKDTSQASESAQRAVNLVSGGQEKVSQMVSVVNVIAQNSEKINKITEVISAIANQTNMLSLNAAIEAARAGEHGAGFAVVAEEVRKLAEHSANSAEQIKGLVEAAVREASNAEATAADVQVDMASILAASGDIDEMLRRVAAAMDQQSATVQEISSNVDSMKRVAENNASASEEITASVLEVSRQADGVRGQVDKFKLASTGQNKEHLIN